MAFDELLSLRTSARAVDARRADFKATPELYNLDVFPYESLLVGLFAIWRGGKPADFELKLQYKLSGANTGNSGISISLNTFSSSALSFNCGHIAKCNCKVTSASSAA